MPILGGGGGGGSSGPATQIRESSGPTTLTLGAVADGQFLKRSASDCVGDAGTSLSFLLKPKYTIYKSGATYYAMADNGTVTNGATGHTFINGILAALTAGRTWKETVAFKGLIDGLAGVISIPSLAILDLRQATLKLSNTANLAGALLQNSDQVNGNTDISMLGGVVDVNYAANANNNRAVTIKGTAGKLCQRVLCKGLTADQAGDASGGGIEFDFVKDCWVVKNHLTSKSDDTRRCGITFTNELDCLISRNVLVDGSIWVDYCDGAFVKENTLYGVNIRGEIWTYTNSKNVDIFQNRIYPAAGYCAIGGNYGENIRMNQNRIIGLGGTTNDCINLASMINCEVMDNYVKNGTKNSINCDFPNYGGLFGIRIGRNRVIGPASTYWAIKIGTNTIVPIVEIFDNIIDAGANGVTCHGISVSANKFAQIHGNRLYRMEQNILLSAGSDESLIHGNVCLHSDLAANPKSGIGLDGTSLNCSILDNVSEYNAYGAYLTAGNQANAAFRHNNFKNNTSGKYDTTYGVTPTIDDNNLS